MQKYYAFLFIKTLIYSIPNTWFLLARQQKIGKWFLKKSQIILIEPLVKTQRLEDMFGKFKEEIIERFEEKFTAQNQKIVDLEEKNALQEKKIENLSMK